MRVLIKQYIPNVIVTLIMRTYSYISIIMLFVATMSIVHKNPFETMATDNEYPCPPYHEETRMVLEEFLSSERFRDQREKMGLGNVAFEEISYLEKHEVCKPTDSPSPRSADFLTTYYKSEEFYFRVNYFRLPNAEKVGNVYNFDNRSHSLMVYDKNFEGIGGVLF